MEHLVAPIGVGLLIMFMAVGVPVAFSLIVAGIIGILWMGSYKTAFSLLVTDLFSQFTSYPLIAILLFVLMGYFVEISGVNKRIFKAFSIGCGGLKGGLGFATFISCAGFAAVCGSSVATAATMGKLAIPEMTKRNYSHALAAGIAAAGGTLGPIIPPSNVFIVYGILAEESIGKLFLAGIIPGLILTLFLSLSLFLILRFRPSLAPAGEKTKFILKIKALGNLLEVFLLFTFVIVGLTLGWFMPSQAGAIGVVGAIIIGLIRGVAPSKFLQATKEGVETASAVLLLIAGAIIYGHFLGLTQVPEMLIDWIQKMNFTKMQILAILCIFYLLGGCFMDSLGFMVLTMPVILPLVKSLNVDLIWFGVIVTLLTEIGTITPPVGINVYVVHQVRPEVTLNKVFQGAVYFLPAMFLTLILIIVFPEIALFLPQIAR